MPSSARRLGDCKILNAQYAKAIGFRTMIPSRMETDYWPTRTIAEAIDQGYSHLPATCSGCGRISDLPWPLLLRRPGITRDTFLGNIKLRCEKCGRNDPVIGVQSHANTQGYGKSQEKG